MKKTGRRTFLRVATLGLIGLFGFIWDKLTVEQLGLKKTGTGIIPFNRHKTVSFDENFLVVNRDGEATVYSAHCTHLGCLINQEEKDRLVCPCHGSQYDLDGNVVKGPACKNLEVIPSKITPDGSHVELEDE